MTLATDEIFGFLPSLLIWQSLFLNCTITFDDIGYVKLLASLFIHEQKKHMRINIYAINMAHHLICPSYRCICNIYSHVGAQFTL